MPAGRVLAERALDDWSAFWVRLDDEACDLRSVRRELAATDVARGHRPDQFAVGHLRGQGVTNASLDLATVVLVNRSEDIGAEFLVLVMRVRDTACRSLDELRAVLGKRPPEVLKIAKVACYPRLVVGDDVTHVACLEALHHREVLRAVRGVLSRDVEILEDRGREAFEFAKRERLLPLHFGRDLATTLFLVDARHSDVDQRNTAIHLLTLHQFLPELLDIGLYGIV